MEEKIKYINKSVADSLQFAEAKNVALITFNGAALYAVIEGKDVMPAIIHNYVMFWSLLLVFAVALSLVAFLPIMNPNTKPGSREKRRLKALGDRVSLFYFGHLRLFNGSELLKRVYEYYDESPPKKEPRSELDLCMQTIVLSRITWRKYVFFSLAGHITMITLIIPIPFLIVYWGNELFFKRRNHGDEEDDPGRRDNEMI